jgi:hypothetical protein
MSFMFKAGRIAKYVVTLGGSERLDTAKEKWGSTRAAYEAIRREADALTEQLEPMLRFLGSQAEKGFKMLAKRRGYLLR